MANRLFITRVTFKLADMATQVEAAPLVHHAVRLKDAGTPSLKAASTAKLFATDVGDQVCSEAVQVYGDKLYKEIFMFARWKGDC